MVLYSRERARRSLFNTIGYRAISQVATLLGYIVLVRALTEQSFGVLSLLYAFIPVVSTLASLGLEQTLRRFQPEYLRALRQCRGRCMAGEIRGPLRAADCPTR